MTRFLTAEWRHLAMLNYQVDPEVLRERLPRGIELDDHAGRHFVSVVGFLFLHTKVRGIPIPFHRDFEEVNLRCYVRREEQGELRRGVVFVKEFVPRRAIAWVARTVYNENYLALPMRHRIAPAEHARPRQPDGRAVEYRVEHPLWDVWRARRASLDADVERLYGAGAVHAGRRLP